MDQLHLSLSVVADLALIYLFISHFILPMAVELGDTGERQEQGQGEH